jgi:hypothetical protein
MSQNSPTAICGPAPRPYNDLRRHRVQTVWSGGPTCQRAGRPGCCLTAGDVPRGPPRRRPDTHLPRPTLLRCRRRHLRPGGVRGLGRLDRPPMHNPRGARRPVLGRASDDTSGHPPGRLPSRPPRPRRGRRSMRSTTITSNGCTGRRRPMPQRPDAGEMPGGRHVDHSRPAAGPRDPRRSARPVPSGAPEVYIP